MSRFYTTYTNRRQKDYGAGIPEGSAVHTRGWDSGVKVVPTSAADGTDAFRIYQTSGSNGAGSDVLLGTVCTFDGKPYFLPSEATKQNARKWS